ncbi:sulfurtransferase [Extensimonas sp. H3M7-6]|uniref:sulfurtransferase n=1 Tax=Extensimonas soli TaxID=3031322 RepID=UPI0023DCB579|nr:sulfurtransferase [Extensimonas sp. H3M7-6]MDF1482750.1 sulfurtransferase [Extensimonas sp. H3M7-6]
MPSYTTLITPAELQALQAGGAPLLVFDCSFDLAQPDAGAQQYHAAHIPGAHYAHLDHDLSAAPQQPRASGGRHPLPLREVFADWLARRGLRREMQVVVYDRNGANFCGRLWWMLKWLGHEAVAVLDGGLHAWQAAGGAVRSGPEPTPDPTPFVQGPALRRLLSAAEVLAVLGKPTQTLIDARATPRYRGEVEPLDPVAGHIPGALNRPFTLNFQEDGRFKPAAQLRAEFEALLENRPPASVVHYCGSGVSAIPNLLAMEAAGLGQTALFAGSWSEWCSDPTRPVARG